MLAKVSAVDYLELNMFSTRERHIGVNISMRDIQMRLKLFLVQKYFYCIPFFVAFT